MRVRHLAGAVAALSLLGTGVAVADPLNPSESSGTFEYTCLYWYDTSGAEQGSVQLCGYVSDFDGNSYRNVEARRTVQTCAEDGTDCTDAYSEIYSGPASGDEFSMDASTAASSFDIVLFGETGDDSCTVVASSEADDPTEFTSYPWVHARLDPTHPIAEVRQGDSWNSVSATVEPTYTSATLGDGHDTARSTAGSGSVCSWVDALDSDGGSVHSRSESNTTYTVIPT